MIERSFAFSTGRFLVQERTRFRCWVGIGRVEGCLVSRGRKCVLRPWEQWAPCGRWRKQLHQRVEVKLNNLASEQLDTLSRTSPAPSVHLLKGRRVGTRSRSRNNNMSDSELRFATVQELPLLPSSRPRVLEHESMSPQGGEDQCRTSRPCCYVRGERQSQKRLRHFRAPPPMCQHWSPRPVAPVGWVQLAPIARPQTSGLRHREERERAEPRRPSAVPIQGFHNVTPRQHKAFKVVCGVRAKATKGG